MNDEGVINRLESQESWGVYQFKAFEMYPVLAVELLCLEVTEASDLVVEIMIKVLRVKQAHDKACEAFGHYPNPRQNMPNVRFVFPDDHRVGAYREVLTKCEYFEAMLEGT